MKKTMVLLTTLAIVFALESAFAGDSKAAPEKSGRLYNGITFFDTGAPVSPRVYGETTEIKPYNGITYFDLGQPKSSTKGYAAGGGEKEPSSKKPYDGITVF